MQEHPYYTDPDFVAKLPKYKTAWSPLYERFVRIQAVWQDDCQTPIISARVQGSPENQSVLFRATELTRFCL